MLVRPKRPPDLSDHARLANKGDEYEKASQQIQAVYQPGKVRYRVRHYKTYKGRIEKNTRTTLPEKYFKFVVHLQTIGMIPVDNLLLEFN